ncbi:MAG: orotidine-5'-phosphate decarboxylase, partial [Cyanobacteria bacterium J06649_4]
LTVHAAAGSVALKASQAAATEGAASAGCDPPKVIAVTLLTSISPAALREELKVPLSVEGYAGQMAQMAKESSLGGAVCSPHEAALLRQKCGNDFCLVCPGVRPTWAQKGDQQRAMTPAQALQSGADYLVIGRPITQATNPASAFDTICEEMAE